MAPRTPLALTAFAALLWTCSSLDVGPEARPLRTHGLKHARLASQAVLATQITYCGQKALLLPAGASQQVDLKEPSTGEYKLDHPESEYYSQWDQDRKLWQPVLAGIDSLRKEGYTPFFVESGALEGEGHSNTLFLEKSEHWHGLLVEPSNMNFPRLQQKGRKAWAFHGALSPTKGSAQLQFLDSGNGLSGLESVVEPSATSQKMSTQAEPLTSLLEKIQPSGPFVVDFWSLDIEGSEGAVLESTDFDKVLVGVLMIEMNKGEENNARIRKVMEAKGFQDIGGTKYDGPESLDRVFVNPKYFEKHHLEVPKPFGMV